MIFALFFQSLFLFAMGWAVLLVTNRRSALPLGHNLLWLGGFGLLHSVMIWTQALQDLQPNSLFSEALSILSVALLPLSAILLIRFGIGLATEAGEIPDWMELASVALIVPGTLVIAYALILVATGSSNIDTWTRYLLYLPGNLLAAVGFFRQWYLLRQNSKGQSYHWMMGAGAAFVVNALVSSVIVSEGVYGLAPWLNDRILSDLTGVPLETWRAIAAGVLAIFVIGALGVFEQERRQKIAALEAERLQAQIAALEAQRAARQQAEDWIDGLVTISRRIANLEHIDDVLLHIVALSRQLLAADACALGLYDEHNGDLKLKCHIRDQEPQIADNQSVTNPAIREALRSAKPRFYQASKHHPRQAWICPLHKCEIQQALIVPLLLDNNCIGALWVTRHLSEPTFQSSDLDNLEHLADQAVIALEHALMAGRLQSLAVVEERGRIAREMHDSLAQILGYVSLQTQTIEALVKQGELDAVLGELKQSRQMIKAAQADVRESILSLRTTLSGEIGLIAALEQYVSEFGVQTGIETAFVHHADHDLLLSPLAEAQLVRIVQEALTNVRKHAQATEVRVNLTLTSDEMRISIRDNGVGFEQRAVERGHFGLQTMRERAESVQGTLQVTSKPGDGTHVEVSLPLLQTARRSA